MAERMGFEPMRDLHLLAVFETAPFNHLGTSPAVHIISQNLIFAMRGNVNLIFIMKCPNLKLIII